MVTVPCCCHTSSADRDAVPTPTLRMHPEHQKTLKAHQERDYFYKGEEDTDSRGSDE